MEKPKRPPLPLDASPQEKYDNLILTFFEEWEEYPGARILFYNPLDPFGNIGAMMKQPSVIKRAHKEHLDLGFENLREFILYVDTLIDRGHLIMIGTRGELKIGGELQDIPCYLRISFSGFNYCHSLQESGKNSSRCFVAMKFSQDMEPFYQEGIVKAIEDNKFRPIRVDKEHAANEQTINDFIIASIKQSRFCVADLTHKSHGAYFEAGYALGRGLKVIYTCREDHFEDIHFDLKSMPIVRYSTPKELRETLSWKIQAFIMD